LSGFNPNSSSEINKIYKHYIGTDLGYNKFLNIKNKYFPTIAPIQNIDGLIKISDFDKLNILFLSKIYYSNVFSSIFNNTKKLLEMNDKRGVPTNGWKNNSSVFHGYSSEYEYSLNSINGGDSSKLYDIDGPWAYSELQKTILLKLMGITDKSAYSYLTKSISLNSEIYSNFYLNFIFSNDFENIEKYKIQKIENDIFGNKFTKFNENNKIFDKLPSKLCAFGSSAFRLECSSVEIVVERCASSFYGCISLFGGWYRHDVSTFF
jgi:hypothetical protein